VNFSKIQDDGAVVLAPRVLVLTYVNLDQCLETEGTGLQDEQEDELDEDDPLTKFTFAEHAVEDLNGFDIQKGKL